MLGWQRRPPHPRPRRHRRPRGRRHADPVLRPGGPPCPRLSGCAASASWPTRRPSTRSTLARRRPVTVLRVRAGRGVRHRRDRRRHRRPARDRRGRGRVRRRVASIRDVVAPTRGVGAADRPTGPRPGLDRGRAGQALAPADGRCLRRHPRRLRRRARDRLGDERVHAPPCRRSAGPTSPKPAYDVVIIGGGGHGLSTAYHLATRHGITNVAVLEADYIASGNTGRNTTIIRANYGIPEAIRFYQHSLELYQAPRGRDRRRDPPPDQGHRVAGPHRDGDAHRARPGRDEPGLRREDVHAHAGRSSRSSSRSST